MHLALVVVLNVFLVVREIAAIRVAICVRTDARQRKTGDVDSVGPLSPHNVTVKSLEAV